MKPRYQVEIPIAEARSWVKQHFGNRATIPWGSKVMWISGLHYITDQPGLYVIGGAGGLEGVQVIAPATENMARAS